MASTFQQPECVRCYDSNCKNCPQKLSVCTLCAVGYYLAGSQCVQCSVANCLACSDASTCLTCQEK